MLNVRKSARPLWPDFGPSQDWAKPFLRIGHGGAAAHAPANTLRSLSLALSMGADVVEFDVRPCQDGLVLLHDETLSGPGRAPIVVRECGLEALRAAYGEGDEPLAVLADALDLVKGRALINLDMKAEGCEEAVLELLRAKGMLGDTLISSLIPDSLRRIRALEPAALTGYSYPEDKRGASQKGYLKPVVGGAVATMRRALPYRLPRMMAYAQANAVMLYHKVVSPGAVRAVHRRGGKVFVWTVDDAAQLECFRSMGVNGVASNHPELFGVRG